MNLQWSQSGGQWVYRDPAHNLILVLIWDPSPTKNWTLTCSTGQASAEDKIQVDAWTTSMAFSEVSDSPDVYFLLRMASLLLRKEVEECVPASRLDCDRLLRRMGRRLSSRMVALRRHQAHMLKSLPEMSDDEIQALVEKGLDLVVETDHLRREYLRIQRVRPRASSLGELTYRELGRLQRASDSAKRDALLEFMVPGHPLLTEAGLLVGQAAKFEMQNRRRPIREPLSVDFGLRG